MFVLLQFEFNPSYRITFHWEVQFSSGQQLFHQPPINPNSKMTVDEAGNCSLWSREENKAFENALAVYYSDDQDSVDWWEKIATDIPGKSLEEIKYHYQILVDDIDEIEAGLVPVPRYSISSSADVGSSKNKKGGSFNVGESGKNSKSDQERRKGIAWTEEEHRLFLLGLENYGKGDWRSISRNFVVSRTPTQVASHAQKYFIRLNSINKDRRRSSIHDITTVDSGDVSTPITGQSPASSGKQHPPEAETVGTPVNLPGSIGYGDSMNVGSMRFSVSLR